MTLYEVIRDNIKTLITDKLDIEGSDSVSFTNFLCRLEDFIFKNLFKDIVENFTDSEREFARIFRGMLTKAKEYFHKKNSFVKSDEIIKYFEKFLWSITEHAKRLGLFVPDNAAADETPPPKKTALQPTQTGGKKTAIADKIKEIEILLNELKTMIL